MVPYIFKIKNNLLSAISAGILFFVGAYLPLTLIVASEGQNITMQSKFREAINGIDDGSWRLKQYFYI